jgi:hypothetical protein|tara:strand:- start:54 stop:1586 length:1533 start_codon:yes stop_codon:yes gene_type:complete
MKKLLLCLLFSTSINLIAQVPNYVPSDSLVGWWPFNGNANDESGNGNNGTVTGATLVNDRLGNPNSAYDFDGINDFINSRYVSGYGSDTFSLSFWIRKDNNPQTYEIICVANTSRGRWGAIVGANNLDMNVGQGCGGCCTAHSHNTGVGPWYHIVFVVQGDSTDIYKDAIHLARSQNSIPNSCGGSLYFGVDIVSRPEYFNGRLDDIAFWDRALTNIEIGGLHAADICSADPFTSQPTDQTVIAGNEATFSFTDTLTFATYQWQMDTGNGYSNLSNAGQFSGTDTNLLTVSTVSLGNDSSFFRCLVTDLTNCEDTTFVAALFVMCTPSPITTQPTDQTVISGNEATFSFTDSLTAASYQWQMDGGTGYSDLSNAGQFSDTDTDSLIISSTTMGNNNTLYRCIVTESTSCLDTTDVSTLTVNDNTSITELNISLVKLFPNPSNGVITLTLAEHSNGQIILTDILGKEVLSKRFNSNEVQLNLKSLEFKGTYFANVLDSAGNVVAIKKLIYQ